MSPWQRSRARAFRNAPRVRVCSLSLTTGCLLCCCCEVWPVAVSKRGVSSQKDGDKQTLWPVISPETTHAHTHPSVTILKPGGLFTGISPVVLPVLWWNRFYLNSQRQRLAEDKPGPVCVGRRSPREQSRFAWRRDVETWRETGVASASETRAAHVRGLFVQLSPCLGADALARTHTHTGWCQTLSASPVASCCERAPFDSSCVRQKRGFAAGGLQVTFLEPQTATGLRCDSLETCTSPYAERCSGSVGSERRPRKTWSVFTPIQVSFKPRLTPLYAWGRELTPPLYATFKEGSFGTMRLDRHLFFQTFALILISPRFFISAKQEAHGAGFYSGESIEHRFCWIYSEQLLLRSCSQAFMLTTECNCSYQLFPHTSGTHWLESLFP